MRVTEREENGAFKEMLENSVYECERDYLVTFYI